MLSFTRVICGRSPIPRGSLHFWQCSPPFSLYLFFVVVKILPDAVGKSRPRRSLCLWHAKSFSQRRFTPPPLFRAAPDLRCRWREADAVGSKLPPRLRRFAPSPIFCVPISIHRRFSFDFHRTKSQPKPAPLPAYKQGVA